VPAEHLFTAPAKGILRTAARKLPGVQVFTSLEGNPAAVNEWRKAAGIQP